MSLSSISASTISNAHISFFESSSLRTALSDSEEGFSDASSNVDQGAEQQEQNFVEWHHRMMRICMGGLYPCRETVKALLAPSLTETKRVLDLGCGDGLWAIEMAKEFPHVEVWGMDGSQHGRPADPEDPSNCKFKRWDPNIKLSEHNRYRFFDLIHIRISAGGLRELEKTIEDAIKCLKPGGLFILIDSTGNLVAEDKSTIVQMRSSTNPNGNQLQRLLYEMNHLAASGGFDVLSLQSRLEEGLWDYSLLDECQAAQLLVPVGSWVKCSDGREEEAMREAGTLMQRILKKASVGHTAVLGSVGFDKNLARQWSEKIASELSDENLKMHLDIRMLWGRRRPTEREPAPPVLVPPAHYGPVDESISYIEHDDNENNVSEHERLKVYNNREEYQKLAADRRNQLGWNAPIPFIHRRSVHRQKRIHSH